MSFAEALRSTGVYEPRHVQCHNSMSRDKLFVSGEDRATPLVHIGRGNCHWYYSNHDRNMFTCGSNPHKIENETNRDVEVKMLRDGSGARDFSVKTLNERIQTAGWRLAEHGVPKECALAAGGAALVALLTLALRARASSPGFERFPHQPPSDAPDTHEPLDAATTE